MTQISRLKYIIILYKIANEFELVSQLIHIVTFSKANSFQLWVFKSVINSLFCLNMKRFYFSNWYITFLLGRIHYTYILCGANAKINIVNNCIVRI